MNILRPTNARVRGAFTMVELALCLAIIGFALVAIMGVLPTGLRVQRDNRDDTVINQDGAFLMEAIRTGARGLDDLSNYVDSITISNPATRAFIRYTNQPGSSGLINGQRIIGLLSTPKYLIDYRTNPELDAAGSFTGRFLVEAVRTNTNIITARVRAISGVAAEKTPDKADNDMSFTYLLNVEVVPSLRPFFAEQMNYNADGLTDGEAAARRANWHQLQTVRDNDYDIRLRFRWPVVQVGGEDKVGNNERTFRSHVGGRIQRYAEFSYEEQTNAVELNLSLWTNLFFLRPPVYMLLTNRQVFTNEHVAKSR